MHSDLTCLDSLHREQTLTWPSSNTRMVILAILIDIGFFRSAFGDENLIRIRRTHVLIDEYGRVNISHSTLIIMASHFDAISQTWLLARIDELTYLFKSEEGMHTLTYICTHI